MGANAKQDPAGRFQDTIRKLSVGQHQLWRIFEDWCAATALTLYLPIVRDAEIAHRRNAVLERYTEGEREHFHTLLECTCEALEEDGGDDFLGRQFMELELGDHWKGQYFTPAPVAIAIAHFTLGSGEDLRERVRTTRFITVHDPAVGAGVMLIAAAAVMRAAGLEPHHHLHATGVDVDRTAAHMAYIQLTLLGIPGVIVFGDSLTLNYRESWPTLAHKLGMWDLRLAARRLCSGA
jgi:hypothetical protein